MNERNSTFGSKMNKSVLPHAKQKLSPSSQHGGEGDSLSMTHPNNSLDSENKSLRRQRRDKRTVRQVELGVVALAGRDPVALGEFLSDSPRGSCLEGMFFPCCAAQLAPCPFVPLSSYCACRRLAMDASCSIERLERMAKMCSWRSWLTSILLTI